MLADVADITEEKGNVLIVFYTSSCVPCRALNPILDEIAQEFNDLKIAKIDVTQNPEVTQMFGVMSLPTVIFMKDRKVKHVLRGLSTKETISSMIRNHIS